MVAFEEGDVGGGDVEVGGHVGLSQAEVPAQALQRGADVQAAFGGHGADLDNGLHLYRIIL